MPESAEARSNPLAAGVLLLDKPAGPTSHDMVMAVRRTAATRRVGHTGTLDPFATGLLVVLVGRATRLSRYVVRLPKQYTGTLRLGATTSTDDLTGTVLEQRDSWNTISETALREAMHSLTGHQRQRPPQFSAKKVGGQVAYRLARRGEPVELAEHTVEIEEFSPTGQVGPDVSFVARVGSGAYVRAMARDLGQVLGCGAHLAALRRIAVGQFRVESAVSAERLAPDSLPLLPAVAAVEHLPTVQLDDASRAKVRFGGAVEFDGKESGPHALVAGGELIAVAEREGSFLQPRVVLDT